jgi:hypothetical protein
VAPVASLNIARRLRNRYFVVEPYGITKRDRFLAPTGERVQLDHEAMKAEGFSTILELLERPVKLIPEHETIKVTPAYLKFLRDHEHVGVSLLPDKRIRLWAMQRLRGGRFVGAPKGMSTISTTATPLRFYNALQKAFEEAT